MAIPCRDLTGHRSSWVVLGRDVCRLSGQPELGEWATPGTSTLLCTVCRVAWRSSAKYVAELPDLHPAPPPDPVPGRIAELVEQRPLLAELTYRSEHGALAGEDFPFNSVRFLHDVARRFLRVGRLSEPQIEACCAIIAQRIERANEVDRQRRAAEAARDVLGERLAPEGDQEVQGVVERAWELPAPEDGLSPPTSRMLLRAERGFTVEVTVPAVIRRALQERGLALTGLVGQQVVLHAKLRRRPDDLTAAWGRYPKPTSKLV
jgi:hypothetical protein